MHDPKQIWQSVLGQLELKFSPSIVKTWFNQTQLEKIDSNKAVISCPSPYVEELLKKRYQEAIKNCLWQLTKQHYQLQFCLQKTPPTTEQGPLFDQPPRELQTTSTPAPPEHNINPRFTFENFVVGNANRVAHAAALAVTEQPGTAYNPLFIYGQSGLGKTHLLYAIGNRLLENKKVKRVLYFPIETFINDFIDSLRYKNTSHFKRKYRENDCLLIDDIQFLGGDKISTQEEFFHTFNRLYNRSRQIVITSDRPPEEIKRLTQRLVTRFAGGLMVELTPPDYEMRLAIIKTKSANLGLEIDMPTAEFIAQVAGESVREIEGLILRIRSETLARDLPCNLAVVKNIFQQNNLPSKKKPRLTPEYIFQLVNEIYNTTISDLCSRKRRAEIVIPRQVVMYLLRNDLGLKLEHIGDLLGGRDHTTIMHGVEKISKLLQKKDPRVLHAVRQIRHQIY